MKTESRHTDPETGERYVRVRVKDYDAWKKSGNALTDEEVRAIKEAHPGYKWYAHRGTLLMKYGEGRHRDRVRKVDGRIEYKRHVHDSPAFTDMMGHPNFGKSFIRYDVLVFASVQDFCEGKDPIEFK